MSAVGAAIERSITDTGAFVISKVAALFVCEAPVTRWGLGAPFRLGGVEIDFAGSLAEIWGGVTVRLGN